MQTFKYVYMYVHFLPRVHHLYGRVDDSEIFKQALEKHCKVLLIRRQRYFIFLFFFLQKKYPCQYTDFKPIINNNEKISIEITFKYYSISSIYISMKQSIRKQIIKHFILEVLWVSHEWTIQTEILSLWIFYLQFSNQNVKKSY